MVLQVLWAVVWNTVCGCERALGELSVVRPVRGGPGPCRAVPGQAGPCRAVPSRARPIRAGPGRAVPGRARLGRAVWYCRNPTQLMALRAAVMLWCRVI